MDSKTSSKNSKEEEDIMLDDYIEQDDDPKLFLDPEDNDEKFLSLEDSLSIARWILEDVLRNKWFIRSFVFLFCIPLFCFLPWYANTTEAEMVSINIANTLLISINK